MLLIVRASCVAPVGRPIGDICDNRKCSGRIKPGRSRSVTSSSSGPWYWWSTRPSSRTCPEASTARTKSVQRTSASPSRAWNDASALSRFCARARATFAALQPLRASFRASSPSSDPRERDCPSGASQSQWPSVVRKYDSPASNWPSTDGLGKRWNCRPCARAIASSTGIGVVTGSMAVTNRHMDAV